MNEKLKAICLNHVAGDLFTDILPDNWSEMSEKAKQEWASNSAAEDYEDYSAENMVQILNNSAKFLENTFADVFKTIEAKMVQCAIDDKFPMDINEVSLDDMMVYGEETTPA